MPRIRSIHPGFFTDEDVVEASYEARLLLIGLGVIADDKGIFPWKPKTIAMQIFPADSVDVADLLCNLQTLGLIRAYEMQGKRFGAIRNFRKHQKPKTPNDIHPAPSEILDFVGLPNTAENPTDPSGSAISEMQSGEGSAFPQKGEIAEQMEDGGEDGSMSNDIQVQFADFWSEWPNKVSKAPAQEAWRSLSEGERAEATKNAARWYRRWRQECPRATKIGASRYLSERRWQDYEGDTAPKPADKLAFYAAWVNSDKHLPANTISQAMLTEMIRAELVTPERARERGLAA